MQPLTCPLCGCAFDRDAAQSACASTCPAGCCRKRVRCPNCGYEIVTAATGGNGWWRRLLARCRSRQSTKGNHP